MFLTNTLLFALAAATVTQAVDFPNPSVNCHPNWPVDAADGQGVVDQLGWTCDSGTPVKKDSKMYNVYGGAKAFVCNWGAGSQACTSEELNEAIRLINDKCGERVAGWVQIDAWAKQYGRTTRSDNPCPNLRG
ncbi:hypothetical protein BJX61DRAFT_546499 [Aspergillus egyptiacus]|nr:hypothetical protein BJX61DRAFT_546499 [Aspergillus egyptiacus]